MADNTITQSAAPATPPAGAVIACRATTYSGDSNALIAPVGIVEFSGSDDAKTATDVPMGSMLGAVTETAPATDTASSGLNGRLQRLAQRFSTFIALIPTALGANGGLKVDIVGDTGQQSVLDTDNLAGVTLNTKYLLNGATVLTPKFAVINASTSGNNTLVAGVTSKKIRVLAYNFIANGTVNAKFQSAASGTDLTGLKYCVVNTGLVAPFNPLGWFETGAGSLLNLNLSAAIAVGGELVYVEI